MKRKINPTRMELLRIKKRLDLSSRGHKLLKDKLQGLIKELTKCLEQYKELRLKVDQEFPAILNLFLVAQSFSGTQAALEAAVQTRPEIQLHFQQNQIMGVRVPKIEFSIDEQSRTYSLINTSVYLDIFLRRMREFFPTLLKMSMLEQTIRILAVEIERTKRRSNALEYNIIPDLQQSKKYITHYIEELSRSDVSRLMKIKDMLMKKGK